MTEIYTPTTPNDVEKLNKWTN